jgi:hypothetical protein
MIVSTITSCSLFEVLIHSLLNHTIMTGKFTPISLLAFFSTLSLIVSQPVNGQACDCDTIISKTTFRLDATNLPAGSVVCLDTGIRRRSLLVLNLNGTKQDKITIKNRCGGRTIFELADTINYGILIQNSSKHFRLTGTGSADFYGILMNGAANSIQIGGLSTDFEVDHIEIKNSGFSGIMAKSNNSGRGSFVMKNVSFHDNYVHHTISGEGFYIGNTSWQVNGNQHDIDSLELYNNITDSTGSEGIQVGCTYSGNAKIYNNRISNSGYNPFEQFQSNGIQLGNGFSGRCYNNYIENAGSNGIIVLGVGGVYVYNNVIVRPKGRGLYTGPATAEPGRTFNYVQNTIIMPDNVSPAFQINVNGKPCYINILNNAIRISDSTHDNVYDIESGITTIDGNVVRENVSEFNFENAAAGNYDLLTGSPAINAGVNIDSMGITTDFENRPRPVGAYDAGAYENQGDDPGDTSVVLYRVNAGGQEVADSPISWVRDKQTNPCPWVDPASSLYTTGSDLPWSGTNNTDAPSQLFSTIRYASTTARPEVKYDFPVSSGTYEVRLYFAENSFQSAGQRVFNVAIEGNNVLTNFDIYAAAGYRTAHKRSFTVNVTDGVLDLDFITVTGNPQINGIAVHGPAGANKGVVVEPLVIAQPSAGTTGIVAYPIPLQQQLYIQKKTLDNSRSSKGEQVEVSLFSQAGKLVYRGRHLFAGAVMGPVDLSSVTLSPGVYVMKVQGAETNEVIKLIKQ